VSTFSIRSKASAFLISTPRLAPLPTPTMIDIGVARPSAQGGNDQHCHRRYQAIGKAGLRSLDHPEGAGCLVLSGLLAQFIQNVHCPVAIPFAIHLSKLSFVRFESLDLPEIE